MSQGARRNGKVAKKRITVHQRADVQVEMLPRPDRRALYRTLAELWVLPKGEWERQDVELIDGRERLYFMPFTAERRAFFSVLPDGTFRVEDCVNQETLDLFFSDGREPSESV